MRGEEGGREETWEGVGDGAGEGPGAGTGDGVISDVCESPGDPTDGKGL